jgi:predicted amidohydrolase
VRICLIQLEARLGLELSTRIKLPALPVAQSAEDGAQLTVLPELWAHGAFDPEPWPELAEPIDGPTQKSMQDLAATHGLVLHAGSYVERAPDGRYFNTSVVYGTEGELLASYRKIHRFGFNQGEAAFMSPGDDLVTFDLHHVTTGHPTFTVGLATCYDLRFPEMFRRLVDAAAQVVIIPAAWPARRREHWRTLLRARAIENQLFVVACAMAGTQAGLEMSGHSMVIDPWGEIVAEAGDGPEVLYADIDPALVDETRDRFPVLCDRRF